VYRPAIARVEADDEGVEEVYGVLASALDEGGAPDGDPFGRLPLEADLRGGLGFQADADLSAFLGHRGRAEGQAEGCEEDASLQEGRGHVPGCCVLDANRVLSTGFWHGLEFLLLPCRMQG